MQLCPHCGHQNYEGVVFCEKCGVALVPVPLSTRQLVEQEEAIIGTSELSDEGVLMLQLEDDMSPIMVQVRQEVILGRISEQSNTTSYINLSQYGADDLGVSRRHARMLRDDRAVYLMDLNSTNGTRLNGEILPSGVEKRLRDGDEIMLGRMRIFVYFKA
ncbi:MAG: FHA domain-containing protein [Chloroflexi bacterium]|nr:FHA domain-containing protein [Chloroflexota bacterium]